jgi:hypothetical protein
VGEENFKKETWKWEQKEIRKERGVSQERKMERMDWRIDGMYERKEAETANGCPKADCLPPYNFNSHARLIIAKYMILIGLNRQGLL